MDIENKKLSKKRFFTKESKESKEKIYEYYKNLLNKDLPKRQRTIIKMTNHNFVIPNISEYKFLLYYSYSVDHLKSICLFYKLKTSGNKCLIVNRIYNFLNLTNNIIKIQKVWKGFLQRTFDKYHGPTLKKRNLCVNATDFFTLDNLTDIPANQFFSFKDNENFIFGFDILSIYNLFIKNRLKTENPYNKKILGQEIFNNIKSFIHLSKLLKLNTEIVIKEPDESLCTNMNMRILSLFQFMDSLGNYTDMRWFTELNTIKLIILLKELYDIWSYRAQLESHIKREICPPFGDPFRSTNFGTLNSHTFINIQKMVLSVMEKLVLSGTTRDNKILGAYYVLSAITLVNDEAALAMPWLYQSVAIT